jgi:hypothetical protein
VTWVEVPPEVFCSFSVSVCVSFRAKWRKSSYNRSAMVSFVNIDVDHER